MAAIMNGMALHGGFIPYGGTFLTFCDYSRNAIRMAALMKLRVIHVLTHDSVGLGEDGPTHQPVEHAASLRLIPNLDVWRPGDAAGDRRSLDLRARPVGPTQRPAALPARTSPCKRERRLKRPTCTAAATSSATAPTRRRSSSRPGSELALAVEAQKLLDARDLPVRVVSMPCTSLFDRQPHAWRTQVLPDKLPRVAVEAGVSRFWGSYGCTAVLGIDTFGESGPGPAVFKHFGFTAEALAALVAREIEGEPHIERSSN